MYLCILILYVYTVQVVCHRTECEILIVIRMHTIVRLSYIGIVSLTIQFCNCITIYVHT